MPRAELFSDAVGGIREPLLDCIGVAEVRRPDALEPVIVSAAEPRRWWNLSKLDLNSSIEALHDLASERGAGAGRIEAEHAEGLGGALRFQLVETNEFRGQHHHLRCFVPRRVVAARDLAELLLGP